MPPTPSLAKAGGATLPSYSMGKCPYCGQMFHWHGGGVANHIWRTPSCCRKKHKLLRSLASATIIPGQDTEEHHGCLVCSQSWTHPDTYFYLFFTFFYQHHMGWLQYY